MKKIIALFILLVNLLALMLNSIFIPFLMLSCVLSIILFVLLIKDKADSEGEKNECEVESDLFHRCAEQVYFIQHSLPLIKTFACNTQKFEENVFAELFNGFEDIWNKSEKIIEQSEHTIEAIFDPKERNSLEYLKLLFKELDNDFKDIFILFNTIKQEQTETSAIKQVGVKLVKMNKSILSFNDILLISSTEIKNTVKGLHHISGSLNIELRNTISRLQYQDISSQETGHILEFISELESNNLLKSDIGDYLSGNDRQNIKEMIISFAGKLSTTGSEYKEVEKLAKEWDIPFSDLDKAEKSSKAGEVTLF